METKTIQKAIEINAPAKKVWEVLTTDNLNRIWYAEFSDGTRAETDWQVGSKAVFSDDTNCGLVSKVSANDPYKLLSLEYTGVFAEGKEDYESDMAKAVAGGREIYRLSETNGITGLAIECDMGADYFEMMSSAWDRALQKIKRLSEV